MGDLYKGGVYKLYVTVDHSISTRRVTLNGIGPRMKRGGVIRLWDVPAYVGGGGWRYGLDPEWRWFIEGPMATIFFFNLLCAVKQQCVWEGVAVAQFGRDGSTDWEAPPPSVLLFSPLEKARRPGCTCARKNPTKLHMSVQ